MSQSRKKKMHHIQASSNVTCFSSEKIGDEN